MQKIKQCPNHNLTYEHLKEVFYKSCNFVSKSIIDAACGASYMARTFPNIVVILEQVAKKNRARYTRYGDRSGLIFKMTIKQRKKEKERNQDIAHMRIQIDLLTKRILSGGLEKVKVMDTMARYDELSFDYDEEANVLGIQGGYQTYNSGNQGQKYGRDNYYGNWQNKEATRVTKREWMYHL